MYGCDRFHNVHQTCFHSERADSCCHVSAVGFVVALFFTYDDLSNQIFYIDAWFFALPYDNDLIIGGDSSAKSVDLLRVRASHCLKENGIPFFSVLWKVFFQEHAAFACAASHEYCLEFSHNNLSFLLSNIYELLRCLLY